MSAWGGPGVVYKYAPVAEPRRGTHAPYTPVAALIIHAANSHTHASCSPTHSPRADPAALSQEAAFGTKDMWSELPTDAQKEAAKRTQLGIYYSSGASHVY